MQLGLTFPLQRRLQLRNIPYGEPADRLYCWDLHVFSLRGEESLLLVHCASRYTIVARGLTAWEWEHIDAFAMEQIRLGLLDGGLPESTVDAYLSTAAAPQLTRTHGRREVAFLNRAWTDVLSLDFTVDPEQQRQTLLEQAVNAVPCRCAGFDGTDTAHSFLLRCFPAK